MNDKLDSFLQQVLCSKATLSEDVLLQEGFEFIKLQLKDYLKSENFTAQTFTQAIKQAREINNSETDPKFWSALEAFYLAVGDSIDNKQQRKRWLRFINIIEHLQGYSGSQLISDKQIRSKRIKRLFLAYTLTWEHLRYIAGNEDDYNPSELVISAFSDAHQHN